jgi:ferredoxin
VRSLAIKYGFGTWCASVALGVAAGCGSEQALVGGRCQAGFVVEGGACVRSAGPNVTMSGTEPPEDEAAPERASGAVHAPPVVRNDASGELSWDWDAGAPVSPTPDASAADASAADANISEASIPDADVPDVLTCSAPLVACRGACISVQTDPLNCGACGKVCPSNICALSVCQGDTPGDIVLVGHDFAEAWEGSAQAQVLLNAVTIATTDPIRVLTWEDGAASASVANVRALLTAGVRGRAVQFTTAEAVSLASDALATQVDVVIVFDAAGPEPDALGAGWATALGGFARKGGVVVALDGNKGGMPALVTAAGLLSVPAHAALQDGAYLVVSAPNDIVGSQVLSPYAAAGAAVTFPGVSPASAEVTWVVRAAGDAGLGAPVVVHRTVR